MEAKVEERTAFEKGELRVAIIKSVGGKRLHPVGHSLAIIVPNLWARANAVAVDGKYYIRFRFKDAKTIEITPVDKEGLEKLWEVNNVQD